MARVRTISRKGGPVFELRPGRVLDRRYVIGEFIGSGYEGEVYRVTEVRTGIERVVKLYYTDRYPDQRRSIRLARKFHRLAGCSVILQYHHHGEMSWHRQKVPYMISELASGRMLWDLIREQRGKRFPPFEALHLTYAIARGVAEIHAVHEYHGDIHEDNVLVERRGIGFNVKLIDLFLHTRDTPDRQRMDVADIANLLYLMVGGPAGYPKCPPIVKEIVCGRRLQVLYRKFPNSGVLTRFMERYAWD